MTIYTFSYLFSSDPANGASNINSTGNTFYVDASSFPLQIPASAKQCLIKTISASIPYVSPNIISGVNSDFSFEYLTIPYTITLPTGLYGLGDLSAAIALGFSNLGLPSTLLSFYGDAPTQRVNITTNNAGFLIDFTQPQNFATILGFNQALYPSVGVSTAGQNFFSPNVASFDSLTSYLVSSDICSVGLPINGNKAQQVIANIPISNVIVGGRLVFDPQQAIPIEVPELKGYKKSYIRISLLDQQGRDIEMLGQFFSVVVLFEYEV